MYWMYVCEDVLHVLCVCVDVLCSCLMYLCMYHIYHMMEVCVSNNNSVCLCTYISRNTFLCHSSTHHSSFQSIHLQVTI